MKCPNCSAECSDQSIECNFCGHPFLVEHEQDAPAAPVTPDVPPPAAPYPGDLPSAARKNVQVPNYLVWAIVVTIIGTLASMFSCCCIPLGLPSGIAAIVYALRVNKFLETGEISSAEQASKSAKLWTWVTTVIAIIFSLWFIVVFGLQASGYLDPNFLEELRRQAEAGR